MLRDRQPLDDRAFRALIVEARAGDERAIEVLFRDLYPRVLRFVRVSEPRAADDIAGEVWLAVARGLRAFDGELVGFRAELMGRDANWVRVTQHRALRRLATALGPAAVADADKNFVDRVIPVESRTI